MNELDWVSKHPRIVRKYAGKWVAVTNKGIVASGRSSLEVAKKSEGKTKKLPMIFKVPRKDEGTYIL